MGPLCPALGHARRALALTAEAGLSPGPALAAAPGAVSTGADKCPDEAVDGDAETGRGGRRFAAAAR